MNRRDFFKGLTGAGVAAVVTVPSIKHGGNWIDIDCRDREAHLLGVRFEWEKGTRPPMTMMEIYVEGDEDKENDYYYNCRERDLSTKDVLHFWMNCTKPPMNHIIKLRLHRKIGPLDNIAFEPIPRDSFKVYTRMIPQSEELQWIRNWKQIFSVSDGTYYPWNELS